MQLKDLTVKAMQVKTAYDKYNQATIGKVWSRENIAEGLVSDVGDLMKLVLTKQGLRNMDNVDEKLAHELSDCLWSIIILAESYDINLEKAFMKNMDELKNQIESSSN